MDTPLHEVLIAEFWVLFNSAVIGGVGYGGYALLSAASFDVALWGKGAAALFAVANVAFVIAKWRKGAFWHSAKSFIDWQEAQE